MIIYVRRLTFEMPTEALNNKDCTHFLDVENDTDISISILIIVSHFICEYKNTFGLRFRVRLGGEKSKQMALRAGWSRWNTCVRSM